MKKICIVTDTASGLTSSEAKLNNIVLVPLSVFVNGKEYQDYFELNYNQLNEHLREKSDIKTAQPNLGLLNDVLLNLKSQDYDDILVFTMSSKLSGTYQAFILAASQNQMTNVSVVDTGTLVGSQRYVSLRAAEMSRAGKSKEEILYSVNRVLHDTVTYLLPENLDQLKRGGRISSRAAALSSMLKIKIALVLENYGNAFEKFATTRTDEKLFQTIFESMKKEGFNIDTHKVFILHAEGISQMNKLTSSFNKAFPHSDYEIFDLPSVIAAHAGLNTCAIQFILKI